MQLLSDGIQRLSFTPSLTQPSDSLILGLMRWPALADSELFLDDVVLSTQRVGCD